MAEILPQPQTEGKREMNIPVEVMIFIYAVAALALFLAVCWAWQKLFHRARPLVGCEMFRIEAPRTPLFVTEETLHTIREKGYAVPQKYRLVALAPEAAGKIGLKAWQCMTQEKIAESFCVPAIANERNNQ